MGDNPIEQEIFLAGQELKQVLDIQSINHDAVEFVLEGLSHLLSHNLNLIPADKKDLIESLYEDYDFINTFLKYSAEKCDVAEELKILMASIRWVATQISNELDSFVFMPMDENNTMELISQAFDYSPNLSDLIQLAKQHKVMVMAMMVMKSLNVIDVPVAEVETWSTVSNPPVWIQEEAVVVGFEDEANTIIDRLTGIQKQLDVISIIGMPGLGKTTLARKVYNNPYIVYCFYIRGWTPVSQVYRKRDSLLSLLNSIVVNKDELDKMNDEKLGELLYKSLKDKRYLILLDDIWNIGAWDDLRQYFPNDNNGSRILLTTRLANVALEINPDSPPHDLRFLNQDESWDLLQQKAFREESCPPELMEIGKQIAAKCQGLPLAIVVVAGLVAKKEKTLDWWNQVAESLSSYIAGETNLFMDVLELSYKHLPCHLKRCFLYAGAFHEDFEIPIWKLTWLWIAEGLIQKVGQKSLEDVAEDYLMDLIDRSLLLVDKRRSNGRVKTCHIHDLLRDFCLRKTGENNLLQICNDQPSSSSGPTAYTYKCFHSQLYYSADRSVIDPSTLIIFKYLRVLVLSAIQLRHFPRFVFTLVHLRFLALKCFDIQIPPEISILWNLETLIYVNMREKIRVALPYSILKMMKLRHLRIFPNMEIEIPCPKAPTTDGYCSSILDNMEMPTILDNIQTISWLRISTSNIHKNLDPFLRKLLGSFPSSTEDVLARTPSLRKLGLFTLTGGWDFGESFFFPDLSNLDHLETLKFVDCTLPNLPSCISHLGKFPPNLKQLTLAGSYLNWEEISILEMLPNLEALTLENNYFYGPRWETRDGGFPQLRFLKLSWMELPQWITSSSHFPSLQRLVIYACAALEEIPSDVGDIPTLQMIELYWSSRSAANSARKIQEEQQNMGNDGLKIFIHPTDEEDTYDLNVKEGMRRGDQIKKKRGFEILSGTDFIKRYG